MSDIAREDKTSNDIFYVCSLIDYIARKTKNHRRDIVSSLGEKNLRKIFELADVYHSDCIENVADDFIESCHIQQGTFDNVAAAQYSVPSHWDIGKVYKRLVLEIAKSENIDVIEAMQKAYASFVSDKIDDYNSSFFYEIPHNIFLSYEVGHIV